MGALSVVRGKKPMPGARGRKHRPGGGGMQAAAPGGRALRRPRPDRALGNRSWFDGGEGNQGDGIELLPSSVKRKMPDMFISWSGLKGVLLNMTSYQVTYFCAEQIVPRPSHLNEKESKQTRKKTKRLRGKEIKSGKRAVLEGQVHVPCVL